MNSLMKKTLKLKDIDRKASYQIAKEISLITLNITWYPVPTIVTGKQIGRASCRERVSSPV